MQSRFIIIIFIHAFIMASCGLFSNSKSSKRVDADMEQGQVDETGDLNQLEKSCGDSTVGLATVKTILADNCLECHSKEVSKGDVVLEGDVNPNLHPKIA